VFPHILWRNAKSEDGEFPLPLAIAVIGDGEAGLSPTAPNDVTPLFQSISQFSAAVDLLMRIVAFFAATTGDEFGPADCNYVNAHEDHPFAHFAGNRNLVLSESALPFGNGAKGSDPWSPAAMVSCGKISASVRETIYPRQTFARILPSSAACVRREVPALLVGSNQ
jgi:hypothetical protein